MKTWIVTRPYGERVEVVENYGLALTAGHSVAEAPERDRRGGKVTDDKEDIAADAGKVEISVDVAKAALYALGYLCRYEEAGGPGGPRRYLAAMDAIRNSMNETDKEVK